jgi:hypothetical protein
MYTSQCTLVKRRIGDSATRLLELMLMGTKNLSPSKQRTHEAPCASSLHFLNCARLTGNPSIIR